MDRRITKEEARALFPASDLLGSGIFVNQPRFIDGREDFCIVKKETGLNRDNVHDHFYIVWRGADGKLCNHQFAFSSNTDPDYINLQGVVADGDKITIAYGSSGELSGKGPWSKTHVQDIGVEAVAVVAQ